MSCIPPFCKLSRNILSKWKMHHTLATGPRSDKNSCLNRVSFNFTQLYFDPGQYKTSLQRSYCSFDNCPVEYLGTLMPAMSTLMSWTLKYDAVAPLGHHRGGGCKIGGLRPVAVVAGSQSVRGRGFQKMLMCSLIHSVNNRLEPSQKSDCSWAEFHPARFFPKGRSCFILPSPACTFFLAKLS